MSVKFVARHGTLGPYSHYYVMTRATGAALDPGVALRPEWVTGGHVPL